MEMSTGLARWCHGGKTIGSIMLECQSCQRSSSGENAKVWLGWDEMQWRWMSLWVESRPVWPWSDGSFTWTVTLQRWQWAMGVGGRHVAVISTLVERTHPSPKWIEQEWWLGSRIKDQGKEPPGCPIYDMWAEWVSSLHSGAVQRKRHPWADCAFESRHLRVFIYFVSPRATVTVPCTDSKNSNVWWENKQDFLLLFPREAKYHSSQM